METIGQRIFRLRTNLGLSHAELGKRVGVSRVAVIKWENGQSASLKIPNIIALCEVFNISSDYLIGRNESDLSKEPQKLVTKDELEDNDLRERISKLETDDKILIKSLAVHFERRKTQRHQK